MARHSHVIEKASDLAVRPPGEFGRSGECGEFGEIGRTLAKLELRLIDTQRFDAMVQRG